MRNSFLISVAGLVMAGCSQKPGAPATSDGAPSQTRDQFKSSAVGSRPTGGGPADSGTITPIGSNVGPITPVAGGENLDGGTGGGLAQAAKGKAKEAAAQSSADANSAASGSD